MKTFGYRLEVVRTLDEHGKASTAWLEKLQQIGAEGWELVATIPTDTPVHSSIVREAMLIFKREEADQPAR